MLNIFQDLSEAPGIYFLLLLAKYCLPSNVPVERTGLCSHVARRVLRVVRYYVLVFGYTSPVYAVL